MLKLLARLIFFVSGWKLDPASIRHIRRAVVIAAPHTSNWDIVYALAALRLLELPVKFTIKKEWVNSPMGLILRPLGAIPIDREYRKGKKVSMTQTMIELFDRYEELIMVVTPEGTRQYAPEWKTGFYRVAEGANVPVLLGHLDYKNKVAGVGPAVYTTGDIDADIGKIKDFYRTKQGRYPDRGIC